jgi:hypothetical protein
MSDKADFLADEELDFRPDEPLDFQPADAEELDFQPDEPGPKRRSAAESYVHRKELLRQKEELEKAKPASTWDALMGRLDPEKTEPGGVGTQAGIGMAKGIADLGRSGNAALSQAAKVPLPIAPGILLPKKMRDAVSKQFAGAAEKGTEWSENLEELGRQTQGPDLARELGATSTSIAPSLVAAPAGIGVASLAAAAQSFGTQFQNTKEYLLSQGLSEAEAERGALVPGMASGLITGLVTRGFGATGVEGWTKAFKTGAVREIVKSFGLEAAEEAVDELGQSVVRKMSDNPDLTLKEAIQQALRVFAVGGFAGLGARGLGAGGKRRTATEAEAGPVPPPLPQKIDENAEPDLETLIEEETLASTTAANSAEAELEAAIAGARVTGLTPNSDADLRLVKALGNWVKTKVAAGIQKYGTAEGNLPEPVFGEWVKRNGYVSEQAREMTYLVRDFYAGVKEAYPADVLSRAAFDLDHVPPEEVVRINSALNGELDINELPAPIRAPVRAMRSKVDELSAYMVDKGLVAGDLAATVEGNLGVYLTRSYRIFDDPDWAKKIPEDVRNKARALIRQELQVERGADASEAEADAAMRMMLEDWRAEGVDKFYTQGKLGSMNLKMFMKRLDIAPEIRALMGEYKNPVVNFAKSMARISRFIGDKQFLTAAREQGLGKFFFEPGTQPPGFDTEISSADNPAMGPLAGLRTTREIAEALAGMKDVPSTNNLFRAYMALNGWTKAAKTVFSQGTQSRNLLSQPFFNAWAGHYNLAKYGIAFKSVLADIGAANDLKWRESYKKYVRLGVARESVHANDLRATLRDAGLRDNDVEDFTAHGIAKALRKVAINAPMRAYQMSDELGKIMGFENEAAILSKIHPDWTRETIEMEAAARVRNMYPTYSMLPELLKQFRKQPVIGPFVSFAYETFRTAYHGLNYTRKDLFQPANAAQFRHGVMRASGQLAVLGAGFGMAALTRMMFGVLKDEMDDVRQFLPRWSKNAQLLITGKQGTSIEYINYSYVNPFSYMTDPLVAMFAGNEEEMQTRLLASAGELMRPFANEQILTGKILDVARNKTANDRPIYNPEAPFESKLKATLLHLAEAFEPGTSTRLRKRIIPAFQDKQTDYGRKLDPTVEVASEITGVKREQFDFRQGVSMKISQFPKNERNAEQIFRKMIYQRGAVLPEQVLAAYQEADAARFKVWSELYDDIQAARRRGVNEREISLLLKEYGVSKSDRSALTKGRYIPLQISENMREIARKHNRVIPERDIKKYRDQASKLVLEAR